jgi:hypothetical protein
MEVTMVPTLKCQNDGWIIGDYPQLHPGIREVRAGVSICQIIFSASFRLIAIGVYGVRVYYSIIGLSF